MGMHVVLRGSRGGVCERGRKKKEKGGKGAAEGKGTAGLTTRRCPHLAAVFFSKHTSVTKSLTLSKKVASSPSGIKAASGAKP